MYVLNTQLHTHFLECTGSAILVILLSFDLTLAFENCLAHESNTLEGGNSHFS